MRAVAQQQEELKRLLDYCPDTGFFRWKVKRPGKIQIGDIAGTVIQERIYIRFEGKQQMAHRLAHLYMTGSHPVEAIDHRDGNPSNNAWLNLRECTLRQNGQNRKVSKANKSGFLGVSKHRCGWQSTIAKDGKYHHLGLFKTPEEAHQAYLKAKSELHTFNPIPRNGSATCKTQCK